MIMHQANVKTCLGKQCIVLKFVQILGCICHGYMSLKYLALTQGVN